MFYERQLIEADRELVEQGADEILYDANKDDVVLLVVGDPFGATTHADILLRAHNLNIDTKVIHNASIINAIGCCGLQVSLNLYLYYNLSIHLPCFIFLVISFWRNCINTFLDRRMEAFKFLK